MQDLRISQPFSFRIQTFWVVTLCHWVRLIHDDSWYSHQSDKRLHKVTTKGIRSTLKIQSKGFRDAEQARDKKAATVHTQTSFPSTKTLLQQC